ncbi:MAG: PTS sugar transporter subunit IIA [Planctomycetota bacterium]|nr:PTS sugar transporter subunit IIA [Planctomycetota bacterium]MDA1105691.1 PTS sugar transporter subunit IIA [Planctomycetota bacterium]
MSAALCDILSLTAVKVPLAATTRQGAIDELVDLLAAQGDIGAADALKRSVWERECQRSTGIGDGLAIPHGKCPTASRLALAVGICAEPIDFQSIDKKPVKLILLLISPPDRITDHIQALGRISRALSSAAARQQAYTATDAQALFDILLQHGA